jgi:DNA repair protein RecO (recombination protein O)
MPPSLTVYRIRHEMIDFSSHAIIMRVKEFGESDIFVTFFTPDKGRLKGVAKGARRSHKRFVNCLDIFNLVNLEYSPRRKSDLLIIHSGKLIDAHPGLRDNFSNLLKASYMIELTEILFPWELSDPLMFEILKKSLHLLSEGRSDDKISVLFEVMAMSQGGYSINLERCCVCGRIYTGEGTAVFKPEGGGIACMKCQPITAVNPKMSPDTVNITRLMQSKSAAIFDQLNMSGEAILEIKPVLKLHREYQLGRQIKTANYLE